MYAVLDIETTGGKYNEEGITEIAIYKFDGHQVIDQFISLVNPEREIQPFVAKLTGINNKMLRNAPKFYDVAKRIVEITEDCIVVAHNSDFDYRVLRTEFKRLGYDYKRKTLCTVQLSKTLLPNQEKYSLGKLVRSLGIPMSDRHRASGDAMATVKLFKLLLDKDIEKEIISNSVKTSLKKKISPKLTEILDGLPNKTGVYYIHNAKGKIIYIGKSKNIKSRVNQHFTRSNRKAKNIQKEVAAVTYEETGSELIALLKESEEIKKNKPRYNRAQKNTVFQFALYPKKNDSGFLTLTYQKIDNRRKPITSFVSLREAKGFLFKITEDYQLCQHINGLANGKVPCFQYDVEECNGACNEQETPRNYNKRVNQFIEEYSYKNVNKIIIDRGRFHDERCAILIEDGVYKGYGFYNLNHQINNLEILRTIITPMNNNRDTQHIIQSYLRRKRVQKILDF